MQLGKAVQLFLWTSIIVCSVAFPKNVWTYVDNVDVLTTLQNLCIQNIRKYALKSNYKFELLTSSNYTNVLTDKQQIQHILKSSQIDISVSMPALIQLQVLRQRGGIWIDTSIILVDSLQWLSTLNNQKFINNRIDNAQVAMFYQPSWLESTQQVTHPKTENLIIAPYYMTWFMAAQKESPYIINLMALYKQAVSKTYRENVQSFSEAGFDVLDYLLDENQFFQWVARLTIQIQQKQFDREQNFPRKFAVREFKVSGIDLYTSAKVVDKSAQNHVGLTCKYLAQLTLSELDLDVTYLVKLDKEIILQLQQTFEKDYVNLDRFHSAGDLLCDQMTIPLRYVVYNSIIERYLIRDSTEIIPVYDFEYIKHHCEGTFIQVYLLFFTKYLLPLLAFSVNCFLTRKALLIIKPQLGIRQGRGLNTSAQAID